MRNGLLLALALTGCSTYQFESHAAVIGVHTHARSCYSKGTAPVDLSIRNPGVTALRIYVKPTPTRQPYALSWLSYDVLDEAGDPANGPGGHGPLPQKQLTIEPGQSVAVIANLYDLSLHDRQLPRQIEISDADGKRYKSPLFKLCR